MSAMYQTLLAAVGPLVLLFVFIEWRIRRKESKNRKLRAQAEKLGLDQPVSLHPYVDPQKCIGCGSCAVACPYDQRSEMKAEAFKDGLFGTGELTDFEKQGYPRYTPGMVTKCDFCSGRVDAGLDPACVVTCPTDARIFGDLDDPNSKPSKLIRERGGKSPLPEKNTRPKVYYID